jgi:hypothetical protein
MTSHIAATQETYSGPLEFGEDLMTINIGDAVSVERPVFSHSLGHERSSRPLSEARNLE